MFKAQFTVEEILNTTKGKLWGEIDKDTIVSLSTDTRTITPEDAYIALCGKIFNGHDFVEKAFENGAKIAIINKDYFTNTSYPTIVVEDTTIAYLELARLHKNKQQAKIIAVTGSSGKTTTKELLYSVFNSKHKTQKSIKNHNNEIGLCQTLLSIEPDTKYCIIEMGMRGLNEIDLLAKYAQPEISIITNAGSAHIGILGSLENIAKAKCEITNYLNENNILFSHNNDLIKKIVKDGNFKKTFYDFNDVKIIKKTINQAQFEYQNNVFTIPDSADYNILNSLPVILTAQQENFSHEEIQAGLLQFKNIDLRNEITTLPNGTIIISDCYNANPDSTEVSLKHVCNAYKDKNIIIVFGDMFELGEFEEEYHKEIGKLINKLNVNYFISVGKLAKITAKEVTNIPQKVFDKTEEAANFLKEIMQENTIVFLKASRGMYFEKILEMIKGK